MELNWISKSRRGRFRLTKNVLETALEAEIDEHLGYGESRPDRARERELATATAPRPSDRMVEIDVPRDAGAKFDRRLGRNGSAG